MAKFADGGSGSLLRGRDLLALVLAHVGYDLGTPEQELHDHSPLIREWLLYPMDPMHDGPGYSSRFPMNKHLSVLGCFKVRGPV